MTLPWQKTRKSGGKGGGQGGSGGGSAPAPPPPAVTEPTPQLDWRLAANQTLTDVIASKVLTATRATTGWYYNGAVWAEAAIDAPRWHYSEAGLSVGLLNEPTRANLCVAPRDLTDAGWTKTNASVLKNATGIDGVANSASRITATAANASVSQTITAAADTYTLSVFLKRVTGTGAVEISIDGTVYSADFALESTTQWARFDITATMANPIARIRLATSGDVVLMDVAQVEVGTFATSPIPTTTTRHRDIIGIDLSALAGIFNAVEGTFVVEATPFGIVDGITNFYLNVSDGTTNERIAIFISNGGLDRVQVADNGVDQFVNSFGEPGPAAPIANFLALGYKANEFIAMNSAGTTVTDNAGTLPTVTTIEVGRRSSASYLAGAFSRIRYYNRRLLAEELALVKANSGIALPPPAEPPPPDPPPDPDPGLTGKALFVPPNPSGYTLELVKQATFEGPLDTDLWVHVPEGPRFKNAGSQQAPTAPEFSNPGSHKKYGYWANNAVEFTTGLDNDGVTSLNLLKIKVYRIAPGGALPDASFTSPVESFVTGGIETEGKYEQQYGYFVTRSKLPPFYGWWASSWVMTKGATKAQGVLGPQDGVEYDLIESARQLSPYTPSQTQCNVAWHYDGYGAGHPADGKQILIGNRDKFHEWGLLWTPTVCIWYVDGVEVHRTTTAISHVPQHVMLTGEVGNWGDWKQGGTYRDLHHARANTGQSDSDLDRMLYHFVEWYSLVPT